MSVTCQIEFENSPSKVLYTGRLIKGSVIIESPEDLIVRGVYLRILGEAFCKLILDDRDEYVNRRRTNINIPIGTEKYLDERITCFDGTEEKTRLPAGTHRYPFQYQLMTMIPTSLEEKYGHIRYVASVRFNDFWDVAPIHEETFTIIKPKNLNLMPDLHEPFSTEFQKQLKYRCFFPCSKLGSIKIVTHLPQRGYTPGEIINLEFDVYNENSPVVEAITVKLVKEVTFYSNNSIKSQRQDCTKLCEKQVFDGFIRVNEKMKTYRFSISIPPTPPTDEKTSSIINIKYKLQVNATVDICTRDLNFDIPITIGTFPIDNRTNILPNQIANYSETVLSSLASQEEYQSPAAQLRDSDLPTYEEAISSYAQNSSEVFKPKYPVYRQAS